LKPTSPYFHNAFTFNGLDYNNAAELLNFAMKLQDEGADHEASIGEFIEQWLGDSTTITVQTSGSTGEPKQIVLQKEHMINSAKATCTFFKLGPQTTALLCLSADYIAGKMMLVRSIVMGWNLHVVAPEADALTQYDNEYDFVAMVPYQVHHTFDALAKVKKLIIGGGAISPALEAKLQTIPTESFATYGMTETCSHVAVRRLNGPAKSDGYTAMQDVEFNIDNRGCLVIDAPFITEEPVVTNDMVQLNSSHSFEWLGRFDNVINSGGLKLFPETIEEKLASFIETPFVITSEKDEALGERIVLIVENNDTTTVPNYSEAFSSLDSFERPKRMYSISKFPYTETGKIKRTEVMQLLQKYK
jgi:O-succinylbenzoic acid--CoA ligase